MSRSDGRSPRLIRPGVVAGAGGRVIVADAAVPVAVVIDVQGVVERVLTWPLRPDLRDREVASAIAVSGEDVWVSSPATGGV